MDVHKLSDADLRKLLVNQGLDVGPVTPTTRGVYEKKLVKVLSSSEIVSSNEVQTTFVQQEEVFEQYNDQTEDVAFNNQSSAITPSRYPPNYQPSDTDLKRRPLYTPGGSTVVGTSFKHKKPLKMKSFTSTTTSQPPKTSSSWCRILLPLLVLIILLILIVYYHMEHNVVKELPKPKKAM